jgi:PBSX family phage terminase large subunit
MTSEKQIKFSEIIAPQFHQVHALIRDEDYSEFWLKGGRGSTKSTFAALQCVIGLVSDRNANAIVIRKTANTLRGSVMETILAAVDQLDRSLKFDHIKSPSEITYLPTNQKIIMRGLDDPKKLKSIKIRKGYFKILWFEEVEEFTSMEEIRSVRQSVLRGGEKFITIFTFNPPRNPNHWIYQEMNYLNPDRFIHHSHYNQVPRHWLGEEFFKIAERLKINNYEAYQHEYDGIPIGNPEEIIFSGHYEVKEFEAPATNLMYQNRFFFGADWGFANDPSTLIRCYIFGECLYIDYEAYGFQTEIDRLGRELFSQVPESKKWKIYGDCSRPETISNVARQGYNIQAAKKWENSVIEGIEYLKGFKKIIIHSRCLNLIKEFQNYSYKVDRNTREVLPKVNDTAGWDHGIDAIRYALSNYIKKVVSIYDVID